MDGAKNDDAVIGVVIIGRNEGARLVACLHSVAKGGHILVYVDSGSTDGSVEAAQRAGAHVVALDMEKPFTAARARNAGYKRLRESCALDFIQFVDGDCEVADDWITKAAAYLCAHPTAAVVCGRRREKFPDRTIYNRLCDREWATPAGDALACGGDALIRVSAFEAAGGYRDDLIAGEEPELCVRLRERAWKIHRLDTEMTLHDVAMTSLGQWLKRARRAGHAFAEISYIHRGKPEQIRARETRRALIWTGVIAAAVLGAVFHPGFLLLLLAYPLQIARIALRDQPATKESWTYGVLLMLQKPWEAAGVIQYWIGRLRGKGRAIIEYKK